MNDLVPIIPQGEQYAVIVDIDGTLANNNHRRHFVERPVSERDWKAFNDFMGYDTVHHHVALILHSLMNVGFAGVLATGRGEEHRKLTETWLTFNMISYDKLYMRPAKDFRSDVEVKRELLDQIKEDGYHPYLSLDDRNSVVAMWRDAGIPTFQVADGDF